MTGLGAYELGAGKVCGMTIDVFSLDRGVPFTVLKRSHCTPDSAIIPDHRVCEMENGHIIVYSGGLPLGMVGLDQMLNCSIVGIMALQAELQLQLCLSRQVMDPKPLVERPSDIVDDESRARLSGWLEIADDVARDFEMKSLADRISQFRKALQDPCLTHVKLDYQLNAMSDSLRFEIKTGHLFYRYPAGKAEVLKNWKKDWAAVTQTYPETTGDVFSAIDLWALGHYTASVFQFMRVLEVGLKVLAEEVEVEVPQDSWYTVLSQIEKAIKEEARRPRGREKRERMQFLSEAAKEFFYFKDGWRNYVSHNHCVYDENQAKGAMEHVRQFMTLLAKNCGPRDDPAGVLV